MIIVDIAWICTESSCVVIVDIIACVEFAKICVDDDMFAGTVIMLCAVVLAPIL